jgi:hypothetical protein
MLIIPVEHADEESGINDKTGKNPDRNKNATEDTGSSGNLYKDGGRHSKTQEYKGLVRNL